MNIPRQDIINTRIFVDNLDDIKYIHYRDLIPYIDETNYQICTKTDFKAVKNTYGNIQETWGRLKHSLKNQIVNEHQSKSGSKYFVTQDGNVYRMSDHWGMVKTCIWTREGKGNMIASIKIYGDMEIGVANLQDFQVIRQKIDWNKDYVINPLWIEETQKIINLTNLLTVLKNSQEFQNLSGEDKGLIGSNLGRFNKHLRDYYSYKPPEQSALPVGTPSETITC